MDELTIKKEEIEDGEFFLDIESEENVLQKEFNQEVTTNNEQDIDKEMKIEKHEFLEDSIYDMSVCSSPMEDDAPSYLVYKKIKSDCLEDEYMAKEGFTMSEKRKRPSSLDESQIADLVFASGSEAESDSEAFSDDGSDTDDDEPPAIASTSTTCNFTWSKVNSLEINPEKLVGVKDFVDQERVSGEKLSPFQWFQKLFPNEIYEHVSNETNKYAKIMLEKMQPLAPRSKFHKWQNITLSDIKAFIAVEMAMGIIRKPSIRSYFSHEHFLTHIPGFCTIFSREEYELIRAFLHFAGTENVANDRLHKIRPILDFTKDLYTSVYSVSRNICVDESMLKFKGRLFFKKYLPSKPSTKWGVKLWSLCDSETGYLLRFNIYTGKDDSNTFIGELGSQVVQSLLNGFENKGHIVYLDNFYSSVYLYEELRKKQIGACGTVRANRKGLPLEMKTLKNKKGDMPTIWINTQKTLLACTWQDTGKVNMLATVGDSGITKVPVKSKKGDRVVDKPNIQVAYNKHMGGVDRFDQLCSTYPFNRRSIKWYQIIWHFLIETSLINSMICYNIQNPTQKLSQKNFRIQIIDSLLEGYSRKTSHAQTSRLPQSAMLHRLQDRHFIAKFEGNHKPNCSVCSIMPSQCKLNGKGPCKRKQTSYYCENCISHPALCIEPCFKIYHTKKTYKKRCNC